MLPSTAATTDHATGSNLPRGATTVIALLVGLAGVAAVLTPIDPRPVLVVIGVGAAVLFVLHVELTAAALAAVIAGNLTSVAVNVHGVPSPSLALAALLLIGILRRPDRLHFLPPPALVWVLSLYGLVVLASALWAGDPERTLVVTYGMTRDIVLGTLVAVTAVRTSSLRLVLGVMVGTIAALATISSVQYLTGSFGTSYFGLSEAVVANIVGGDDDWRVTGTLGDPNYYAQALTVGTALALGLFVHARSHLTRLALAGALIVTVLGVVTTFSRGGFLALAGLIAAVLFLHLSRRQAMSLLVAGMVVLVVLLPGEFRDRLMAAGDVGTSATSAPQDAAVAGRLSEMLAGAAMFVDEPLLGVGAGNYPARYQEYSQRFQLDPRRMEREAHSLYVEVAAEIGVLGLAAAGVVLIASGRSLARHARRQGSSPAERLVSEAIGLGLLAFLLTSVFLHAAHGRLLWLLLALALCLPCDPVRPEVLTDPARGITFLSVPR